jgi:Cu2+-exporting ATPase
VDQLQRSAQQIAKRVVDQLAGSERQSYRQDLASPEEAAAVHAEEQQANLYVGVAFACLVVASVGKLFYPPLMVLSLPGLLYTAYPFVKSGFDDLRAKRKVTSTTLDLVAIPTVILMGNYFAASLAVALLSLSQAVLKRTEERSMRSMVNVFGQQPAKVWALVGNAEVEIPFTDVRAGDVLVVAAGQMVPADGVIVGGDASVDQRMLTGESQPSEKMLGDEVFAGSILLAGRVWVEVKRAGEATVAAQIGEILTETAAFKQTFESRSQQLSDRWSLPTLAVAGVALPLYGVGGSIAVLLSSLGYNLRIVGPLSMLNFLRLAAQQGVLVKEARALELLPQIDTVVFDKTGTLTLEQPRVVQIHLCGEWSADELLRCAAAAESRQSHPIARAIVEAAQERGLALPSIAEARYEVGYGIKVGLEERVVRVGSERFLQKEQIEVPAAVSEMRSAAHALGHSWVLVAVDDRVAGAIELAPTLRPGARRIIETLHSRGLSLYILSGDQEQPTRHLAQLLGIEQYFANTLPEHKADKVRQLQGEGRRVCFIGDGINDAIALQQADLSISLRGASTIATDTAQIVLMDGALDQLVDLFVLAKHYERNMRSNYVASMAPGLVVIGGVFLLNFGVIESIMLYNLGLIGGVANSMLPLLQGKHSKANRAPSV